MSRPNDSTTVPRRPPPKADPLPRGKLPDELQKIVDDDDTLMEALYDGTYVLSILPPFPTQLSPSFPSSIILES